MIKKHTLHAWLIVITAMLFYAYNYSIRTAPSTILPELMHHFDLTATAAGSLIACYYYSYTSMQIPVGILLDRLSVRFVLLIMSCIAVLGLALFTMTNNVWIACIGRLLVGFGCAFSYIGVTKLASRWLPVNQFATAAGLTTALGMLAGATSDLYLTQQHSLTNYKAIQQPILYIGIGIIVLLFFIIKDNRNTTSSHSAPISYQQYLKGFRKIVQNPQMWIISLIACLAYLPSSVFLDLWGLPFLEKTQTLTPHQASSCITFMFAGWIISAPLIGFISDKLQNRRIPLAISSICALIVSIPLIYAPQLPMQSLSILLFCLGFFAGAQPLVFSLGIENNKREFAATSIAFVNTLTMLGGMLFQPIVGVLLDWHASQHHGLLKTQYAAVDYHFALSILPISFIITTILALLLRSTRQKRLIANSKPSLHGLTPKVRWY